MTQLMLDQTYQRAFQHHRAGQLREAEQLYRQILEQQPNHAEALHHLGLIIGKAGRKDLAVNMIRRAIALNPNWPEAHYNLGNALMGAGQFDEAIAAYRRAIALQPNWPDTHNNLGTALKKSGQINEALIAYRQAIVLNPSYAEVHCNVGIALQEAGQIDEAIAAYRRTIALKPDFPDAHSNLGVALKAKGQLDDALAACRKAIALRPDLPDAHNNLGNALLDQGNLDHAIAAYRQAIAIKPDYSQAHSNLVLALHFHPGYDAEAIAGEYRQWNRQHAEPLKGFIRFHDNERTPDRRLRIGYVSADLTGHSVGRFLLPLLAQHDKTQFEVFAYSQVRFPDAMTQRLRSCTDVWRSIVGPSDAQAADLIRQDHIDILIDLAMHTAHNRLLVFAHKPAPVQATYLAYCSSTGMETIDYRLSDPYLDPPGGEESFYSEQTIRLPETYWCYQSSVGRPEVGPLPALKRKAITFGCLNNFCKVNEPMLVAWARILRAVPDSLLLLHGYEGSHRQRLQDRLKQEGIEPARVHFAGKLPIEDYFALYRQIDIALDTFPYGGGTTTCDALWMGVPVVSLDGKTAVSRAGLSILSNLGLPELVAGSKEEYVQIAMELAGDLPRLSDLRSTLRQRMEQSPLMDAPRFARGIEAAYRHMWRKWCA